MTTATHPGVGEDTLRDRRVGSAESRPDTDIATYGRRYGDARDTHQALARRLAWLSLGLGAAQVLAPARVARAIGVEDDAGNCRTLRAVGLREVACGVGLLALSRPAPFAWARVGGDVLDLALLGRALKSDRSRRARAAAAAVVGVTVVDVLAGRRLGEKDDTVAGRRRMERRRGIRVRKAITVDRSPEECYRFWRDFENLPRFMAHLESVRQVDDRRSFWRARAPLGAVVEWDAELVEDRPGELIAWRSLASADIPNAGRVRFNPAPLGRGTEVRVEMSYDPPGGAVGAALAKLFGREPSQQVDGDLRRFKQVMEVGAVVHSDASIHPGLHPAQPPAEVPPLAGGPEGELR